MSKERIQELIEKYLSGNLTAEEEKELDSWYSKEKNTAARGVELDEDERQALKKLIWQQLSEQTKEHRFTKKTFGSHKSIYASGRTMIAAAIFLLFAGGVLFYVFKDQSHKEKRPINAIAVTELNNDIAPGKNGATLHLSNGQIINLDSLKNGTVVQQGNVKIVKDKGQLRYLGESDEVIYNDITTARGQRWQLSLPDGTKVWLNAESSIHYPLCFNGNERLVTVTGEAYFEVVHDAKKPFRVKAGSAMIEDLGTKFNINAYKNEAVTKTTLVQGSVEVSLGSHRRLLIPGQQAVTNAGSSLEIRKADVHAEVGWKNQEIVFDNRNFQSIMREVERWYNLEVIYKTTPPSLQFQGSMSSTLNLSQFLKILDFENVHYQLNGHILTIIH